MGPVRSQVDAGRQGGKAEGLNGANWEASGHPNLRLILVLQETARFAGLGHGGDRETGV